MVPVSVGEGGRLYGGQVHSQGGGVFRKTAGGACVQQHTVPPAGQVEGQSVLVNQAAGGGVFHQNRDLHHYPAFRRSTRLK